MKKVFIVLLIGLAFFISCDDEPKERVSLLGSWKCEEFPAESIPSNYQVNIIRNHYIPNSVNEYLINNFYKMGSGEAAAVAFHQDEETGELIIPEQIVQGNSIYGTGTVTENFSQISWVYYVNSGVVNEKVVATYY